MNDFVIDEIVDSSESFNGRLFPLARATKLKREFATMFSSHLGRLKSGFYFEGEVLLVTGASGAGKTTELEKLLREFPLEPGYPAKWRQSSLCSLRSGPEGHLERSRQEHPSCHGLSAIGQSP